VMLIGLADSFESFLVFRLLIGAIGASFVVTQCHTSLMFAPNCVGTANAAAAGWGNLGGGVTQCAMPLVFAFLVGVLGLSDAASWRVAMALAGGVCFLTGIAYYRLTQDSPAGNFSQRDRAQRRARAGQAARGFRAACRDRRVWALAALYGGCFGIELTIDNIAALYFVDYFGLGLQAAGWTAAAFGSMNLFARALGGLIGDRCGRRWGLAGRVHWLFAALVCEGLALMLFSQVRALALAVPALMVFGLFVKMANGATYSVVPLVNPRALGSVSGIVGAGGNVGAVLAGFLLTGGMAWPTALLVLGCAVLSVSFLAFLVQLAPSVEPDGLPETAALPQVAGPAPAAA